MDIKSELKKIYTNRFLQSQKEISNFEGALRNLIGLGDTSVITDLCMGFDDDTEQYEIMFGLVHGIEHLYLI
ncbi:Imm30 family immunity protein [Cytobacillus oceanisediminis]|uniref:Imm30 family immunity protein n=1 Tax=Cytobacillus oceanisediminis TaxID=665099 RepID=UPI0024953750|nr:Imm30 family immunity protein [Cytobacillus oceanisediminis]